MFLVFSMHEKFLKEKNHVGKAAILLYSISMLQLPLLTADGKGWRRREGSRDNIHIITFGNVA